LSPLGIGTGEGNITIAGQTAPGGGILLAAKSTTSNILNIDINNVIIRYLRIRRGQNSSCATNSCGNIAIFGDTNIILDHISSSWTQDDSLSIWGNAPSVTNVTVQNSIFSEGFTQQSTAIDTGSGVEAVASAMTNIDIHHNFMSGFTHRGPFLGHKSGRLVNNITYNLRDHMAQYYGGISVDAISNVSKRGPMSGTAFYEYEGLIFSSGTDASFGSPSMYMLGNIGWNQTNPDGDQWALARQVSTFNGPPTGTIPTAWRRVTALTAQTYPISETVSTSLAESLLPTVGAYQRLDCYGAWVDARDSVDARLVSEYNAGTGVSAIPANETVVGGYPTIAAGTTCSDKDLDGMPDAWEEARGYNPNNPANRNTVADNGFTYLENFLNGQ